MGNIPILLYHQISHVTEAKDPYKISVTPEQFQQQMAYLHDNQYQTVSLADMLNKVDLPPQPVVITFDDGYLDNYENAYPILKQYGFAATIFLVSDRVGKTNNWDTYSDFPLMSWEHVRELSQNNFEFGSHTHTHASLDQLEAKQARWEIEYSKQVIEDHLGQPVSFLAYPYTRSTPQVEDLVAACGYTGACGSMHSAENIYNLWRAEIGMHDTPSSFAAKLSPWWHRKTEFKRRTRFIRGLMKRRAKR